MLAPDIRYSTPIGLYDWTAHDVVIIASGPYLNPQDVPLVKDKAKVITVNTSYELAPWADIHYSSDCPWWLVHYEKMDDFCCGDFWTGDVECLKYFDPEVLRCIPYFKRGRGVNQKPYQINWGGNSGFCALQLAYKTGTKRIFLMGYDMAWDKSGDKPKTHYFGDHPEGLKNEVDDSHFKFWIEHFNDAAKDFKKLGVEIINLSEKSSIECFPKANIRDYFA